MSLFKNLMDGVNAAAAGSTNADNSAIVEGREDPSAVSPRVRKAVFPVAGLGTRFLPATKAVAKEMLPVVDRPLIQYAVDEALAAGIEEMIFITSRSKRAIEDHFDTAVELEQELQRNGKDSVLDELKRLIPPNIKFSFVRQPAPLGLGHAVQCAEHAVGGEPFAVLLPDDLIDATRPALAQMVEQFNLRPASLLAVQNVRPDETHRYGICDVVVADARVARLRGIVEKPKPAQAPSTLGVVGRYVFTPAIFDCLRAITPGVGGELQLTDAVSRLLALEPVFAYRFSGERYDCGSKEGMMQATVMLGLRHPEIGSSTRQLILQEAARLLAESQAESGSATLARTNALTRRALSLVQTQ
jgi:UTP--glucose-1-phosphate uridylyltransferase